jgi:hypothetical protein
MCSSLRDLRHIQCSHRDSEIDDRELGRYRHRNAVRDAPNILNVVTRSKVHQPVTDRPIV